MEVNFSDWTRAGGCLILSFGDVQLLDDRPTWGGFNKRMWKRVYLHIHG